MEKQKFISSVKNYNNNDNNDKKNFIKSNPCFLKIIKPYLKNIKPAAALMLLRKSKIPNNVIDYILAPMINIKLTKRKHGGKQIRRINKTKKQKTKK